MAIDFSEYYSGSSFNSLTTSSFGKSANDVARELIARSISRSSNISLVYKELLRSVLHAFSGFSILDGEDKIQEVTCLHGTQERAVAKLTEDTNLILPIISIDQPNSNRDSKRQRYKPLIVSEKQWDPVKNRAIRIVSLVPVPIEIEYEVTVWCKYKGDLDQLTEQIHYLFNPDVELVTPFATNIKLFIKEEAQDSQQIAADREDRLLRRIFKIHASTYIPSPKFLMTSTGKIEDFNYEVDLATGDQKKTFESFFSSEEFMPDPNAMYNASALLGSAINISPVAGAALVYYGNSWAASDTFLKASDIAELTAKVDSVEWGARYYRPDFVKLAYVSQYGTGETGGEVEGQGNSDLWTGTSAYGEIARWFIPELSFRGQGILDVNITGYFDPSVTPTTNNYTLQNIPPIYVANYFFSGITVPSSYTFINTSANGEILDPDLVAATRLRFMVNRGSTYAGATFPVGYSQASSFVAAGTVRSVSATNNNQTIIFQLNSDPSALNQNSYFTITENYSISTDPALFAAIPSSYPDASIYKPYTGGFFNVSDYGSKLVSSLVSIYKAGPPASGAVLLTSSDTFNGSAGDTLIFYQVNANFSSLAAGTIANVSSYIELATDVSAASSLSAILNADSNFTAATGLNLSSYVENNKLALAYQGTTDNYQWGVIGTLADKLGLSASSGSNYKYAYKTKTDTFDWKYPGASVTPNFASAIAVFELQMADDPYDDILDYTDLPYGVDVSTLGFTVYDPSGAPYAGNINTSTLYPITYQAPPSAVGLVGVATRGFPQPWTTIATFETGISSLPNVYSTTRGDFDINIKFKSAGFFGATYYQPYVIEITQASGAEAVTKKIINRTTMDVTKDKMMRVRFKCIQFSDTGNVVYYTDIPGPYQKTVVLSGDLAGTYYYGILPRVCTVTTLAATLSCPGDGHPF